MSLSSSLVLLFIACCTSCNLSHAELSCINCRGIDCQDGSCQGDACIDELIHNSHAGSTFYNRGCLQYLAGGNNASNIWTGFSCSAGKYGDIIRSSCVCNSADNCNTGTFHTGNHENGPQTCEYDNSVITTEASVGPQCQGDRCTYDTSGTLGKGCQYFSGDFVNYDPKNPPKDFEGCYKTNNTVATNTELCTCNSTNCNQKPGNASYDEGRSQVTCVEAPPFATKKTACIGHACYITGANVTTIDAFERGCIIASDMKPVETFCVGSYDGGGSIQQISCICADSGCNNDVEAAIQSIQSHITDTTTQPTTITTTTPQAKGAMSQLILNQTLNGCLTLLLIGLLILSQEFND